MIRYFFDTNAVVRGYIPEGGLAWANGVIGKPALSSIIYISELAIVEFTSAIYKLERDKRVRTAAVNWSIQVFDTHVHISRYGRPKARFHIIPVDRLTFEQAKALISHYRSGKPKAFHSLDAIQLQCAIDARGLMGQGDELIVVTEDQQLAGCAVDQRFRVINPASPPSTTAPQTPPTS